METISAALDSMDVGTLTSICEEAELDFATQDKPHPYATFHLLGLLLQGDLTEARFLWKRLPSSCKENSETVAAWSLGRALWKSNHPSFYETASQFQWAADAKKLVAELVRRTRCATIKLVGRAYSCIKLNRLEGILGLERQGVNEICDREGWSIDDNFVTIAQVRERLDAGEGSEREFHELQMLTEQLVRLQTTS